MKEEYKLSPCIGKPGFYAIDEPDFNVVLAVFRGEKELAEGNWHLVNKTKPEYKEGLWYPMDKMPIGKAMMCEVGDGLGNIEYAYWNGYYWFLREDTGMKPRYFDRWRPAELNQ